MKIKFGTFTLAEPQNRLVIILPGGDGQLTGPTDFEVDGESIPQFVDLLRAVESKTFDRKNRRTTVRFSATHRFNDYDAAEAYIMDRARNLPNQATLEITSSGGGSVRVMTLAFRTACKGKQIGVTCLFSYEFTGGQLISNH